MNDRFAHLHVHTQFSYLDGFGSAEQYVLRAKEMGFAALATTDHGNVDGVIKFQKVCLEHKIAPLVGVELYIIGNAKERDREKKSAHITVLAKNRVGFKNILKILTYAHTTGFYYKPRIDFHNLLSNSRGLIVLSGCSNSFLNLEGGEKFAERLIGNLKGDFYFELMPHDFEKQLEVNKLAIKLSKKYGNKCVVTNDCHYILPEDAQVHDTLLAIQTKSKVADENRYSFSVKSLYLKSYEEMEEALVGQGIVNQKDACKFLENTMEIVDKCKDFRIERKKVYLPPVIEGKEDKIFLYELCMHALKDKGLDKNKKYLKRVEEEYEVITSRNFERYFLIVWDMVKWCKGNNVFVGPGRGSCGGSLVAYLLGITMVDPFKFDLLFSRFISSTREDLPDIDLDFEDVKRQKVREYLISKYGQENVAGLSTFLTMKGKMALRDVCRAFDIPLKDVDKIAKSVNDEEEFRVSFESGECATFRDENPEIVDTIFRLENQVRGVGQHPAAIVLSKNIISNGTNAYMKIKDENRVVNWDMKDAEYMGMIKLDVLGLNTLTVLSGATRLIKERKGVDVDFSKIELDDPKVLREFTLGHSVGCFQFSSHGIRKMCGNLSIDSFEDIVMATSLYRPSTLRTGMVDELLSRKKGDSETKYYNKKHEEITKSTFGMFVYQEQIMRVLSEIGGMSIGHADNVRKAMEKSDINRVKKYREEFIENSVKSKELTRDQAVEIMDNIESMSSYSFCKAHAVEYSFLSYWGQWLKIYYPLEFICANLTHAAESKKDEIIGEGLRMGIKIQLPKIGFSDSITWRIIGDELYCPFIEIKGFGEKTADKFARMNGTEKSNEKMQSILSEIDRYTKGESIDISKYFSFRIPKYKMFEKIIERISHHSKIHYLDTAPYNRLIRIAGSVENKTFTDFNGNSCEIDMRDDYNGNGLIMGRLKKTEEDNKTILAIERFWPEDIIIKCDIRNANINLLKEVSFINKDVQKCEECSLRKECKRPSLPTEGKYNLMIIGEAPGKTENKVGICFCGPAGTYMWEVFDSLDLYREFFHVTNVCKCFPSYSKKPSFLHIDSCRKWLDEEIRNVNPILILALGNTALRFFEDVESGITKKNATIEWNEEYNCWICWCLHPSSVLHDPDKKKEFEEGISFFAEKVKNIGKFE